MTKEREEKFKEWLEQSGLTDKSWNDDWYISKSFAMFDFSNMIASEYLDRHAPDEKYSSIGISRLSYFAGPGNNAAYAASMIFVNPRFADRNTDVMLLLAHEATHHGQNLLYKTDPKDLTKEEQAHRAFISATIQGHDSTVFGIDTSNRTYVVPQTWKGSEYEKLATVMYVLSPGEREAREAEIRIQNMFGITSGRGEGTESAKYEIEKSTEILKERYNAHNLTDEELHKLMDNATINVTTGRIPTNPIEASMTYDLAVLTSVTSPLFKGGAEAKLDSKVKAETLTSAGFENVCTIGSEQVKSMTLDDILSLTPAEVKQNPHAVAHGICEFGLDAVCQSDAISDQLMNPEIGDSSFDRWYFSELNTLSSDQIETVSLQLGSAYSQENIQEMISKNDFVTIDLDDLVLNSDVSIDLDQLFSEDNGKNIDAYAAFAYVFDWTDGFDAQDEEIEESFHGGRVGQFAQEYFER